MFFPQILIALLFSITTHSQEYSHPYNNHNQALDYYQIGEFGKAMFYSKRAMLLDPSNIEIRKLFYTIRHDIGLPPIYATDTKGAQLVSSIIFRDPPHITVMIGGALFFGASLLVSLLLLGKIRNYKKIALIGIWIGLILSLLLFIKSSVQYYFFFLPDQRIIIETTKAYEEPSIESSHLLDLPAGTEVTVVVTLEDFYLVRTLDGKEYWINPIPELWIDF
ncbi:MAG: hypothetical protein ACRCWI_02395 [Brevinema sp.]